VGDAAKKKQTVRRMTHPPMAPEPDIIDAQSVDDIVTTNVFYDMPTRYEHVNFFNVERIWFSRI
jgi:hypothetical protein